MYRSIFTICLFFLFNLTLFGQKATKVSGVVIDAETNEPLPFVNVYFLGTTVGTTTDFDGKYLLDSRWPSDSVQVSFIGYENATVRIEREKSQTVDFKLVPEGLVLEAVTVKAKKGRYRKRDNPAVALIRKVIANKKLNRLESADYYELDKYEKVELDLNNISEDLKEKKAFKKFKFLFEYVDTSEMNGKPFLPIFMQELATSIYYRKKPKAKKEFREGYKITGLDKYLDDESITVVMEKLYDDIDISKNDINLLTQNFVSPLSIIAPDFYRFYIIDTINYKGQEVIDLAFIPKNKSNLGFKGNLYINLDSSFQVIKVEMGVLKQANLNFVRDLLIEQEFEKVQDRWCMTKEHLVIDYNLTKNGLGFFGKRTVFYQNHKFEEAKDPTVYTVPESLTIIEGDTEQDDTFWANARSEELTENEEGVYQMVDTLFKTPTFRRIMDVMAIMVSGYHETPKIDVGPFGAFYSFNEIEGFRLRAGGRTNLNFAKKFEIEGYGAYGFKDREWKYAGSFLWTFNDDFRQYPKQHIKVSLQHETNFPGQLLQFVTEDNFFLSFKRGNADKMLFFDSYNIEYHKEYLRDFSYTVNLEKRSQRPLGSLSFQYNDASDVLQTAPAVNTVEAGFTFKWAPRAEYFKTDTRRIILYSKNPIFDVDYRYGINGLLGGEHEYHLLKFHMFKRFRLSILGFTYSDIEFGKIWGSGVPYIQMFLPRANQTYAYQVFSYNMMNFLEFVTDTYVSVNVRHFFNGFIFNKIPLIKKLKLREVVTFKGLYGTISDKNDPEKNDALIQFSEFEPGVPQTYSLRSPYLEGSVGISNIAKLFRVDVVQRFTHLDHPDIPKMWGVKGLGLRVRLSFEF